MKTQLKALISRWEKQAKTCDTLARNAGTVGMWQGQNRCETKAGMFRSLAAELRQEIKAAEEADREEYDRFMSDIPCQDDGHGHECK